MSCTAVATRDGSDEQADPDDVSRSDRLFRYDVVGYVFCPDMC